MNRKILLLLISLAPFLLEAQNGLSFFEAIDPQNWQDQQDMTWNDYQAIPGHQWSDRSLVSGRTLRIALVAVDFPDQAFVITQKPYSDMFGNPQIDPVMRDEVPEFYADFYNNPLAVNKFQTINGYWMEQSWGDLGIPPMDFFGPYQLPKNLFEYGLNEFNQEGGCPPGFEPNGRLDQDCDALWRADAGSNIASQYDIVLRIYAGYDETSVWQEFGEMMFNTKEDIPPEWGNPDTTMVPWVTTRYIDWTSWKAGQMQWGSSSMRQAESSGTITHEISHYAFHIGDNNNNPYVEPYRRVASGPWDIMDRGSFNGPGGPHRRWVVPAQEGASMPAGLMLRSRLKFGFVQQEQILELNRNGLDNTGLAVARVIARAVKPGDGLLAGIKINLDGRYRDMTPVCDPDQDPLCAGSSVFNFYTLEVIQRIGYDSFTPDQGVLISKNKNNESNSCGYNCFTWVIDAHPEDMNMVDFYRPDGTPVIRTIADYRQLNDALFHAGTNSGSSYEWIDEHNQLHFYIIDIQYDDQAIASYQLGVRSLVGSGEHIHGIKLSPKRSAILENSEGIIYVNLMNTGEYTESSRSLHPSDARPYLHQDIYRMSAEVSGEGWEVHLQSNLIAVPFGERKQIPIGIRRKGNASDNATINLTITSESDQSIEAVSVIEVQQARNKPIRHPK